MASSSTSSLKRSSAAEPLSRSFYERDTVEVARDLLGKLLAFRPRESEPPVVGRIVETEAYHGDDPASHCARGETPRCAIMFGDPGVAYVYFIYGMYEMLNFVTERRGYPGAVLIRALEPVEGMELMRRRRLAGNRAKPKLPDAQLANGPGRLCRALGIRLEHNGESLEGPLFEVHDDGTRYSAREVRVGPRVGITAAREKPWRFFVAASPSVSKVPQNAQAVSP
jgi:DNA-3-methyladenine glycosylase